MAAISVLVYDIPIGVFDRRDDGAEVFDAGFHSSSDGETPHHKHSGYQ